MNTFNLQLDEAGILTAALNVPGRSMNTITREVTQDLSALVARLKGDATIAGLVLCSGKSNGFCAGADLGELDAANTGLPLSKEDAIRAELAELSALKNLLRALETCGKPVVAAINGLALGGGLEILLATHHRVSVDDSAIQLGLPEATIGLLPGAGGTQRLPRLVGIEKSLPLLLEGRSISVREASQIGLVDRLVPAGAEIDAAKEYIRSGGASSQPWDRPGFRLPGGGPYEASAAMVGAIARVRKTHFGNSPGPLNTLRCVYEGSLVPIDAGLRIETRYFFLTRNTPQAKAMVRSLFLSMQGLRKGVARPAGIPKSTPTRLVVVGAGMMGAGIAAAAARAAIHVILLDRTSAEAERGRAGIGKQFATAVSKGRMSEAQALDAMARIIATDDYEKVRDADMAIEAVFEDRAVKALVMQRLCAKLPPDAVIASNTSSLPISELAAQGSRPESVIGLHFFSPVDRMALVEVIRGRDSSERTLARALDLVALLRKTPIVVRDSRGFYTSRTFGTYLDEGFEMLAEGIPPALLENVARSTGMPRAPLELADDVGLDLCWAARQQLRKDLGQAFVPSAQDSILQQFVETEGRHGRKNGRGFYDYADDRTSKRLRSDLAIGKAAARIHATSPQCERIGQRLLYRQSLEAARALSEGVLDDPRYADVGALLGWGFPAWTGGPLSLIDQVGTTEFVRRCDVLRDAHGTRFAVPEPLREMAVAGVSYYPPTRGAG